MGARSQKAMVTATKSGIPKLNRLAYDQACVDLFWDFYSIFQILDTYPKNWIGSGQLTYSLDGLVLNRATRNKSVSHVLVDPHLG